MTTGEMLVDAAKTGNYYALDEGIGDRIIIYSRNTGFCLVGRINLRVNTVELICKAKPLEECSINRFVKMNGWKMLDAVKIDRNMLKEYLGFPIKFLDESDDNDDNTEMNRMKKRITVPDDGLILPQGECCAAFHGEYHYLCPHCHKGYESYDLKYQKDHPESTDHNHIYKCPHCNGLISVAI